MDQFVIYTDALVCGARRWNLIWGDPFLSASIFMVTYALAAMLILQVARRAAGRERWLWYLCGLFFIFQVFNTPLDLHAFPGAVGHCLAKAQGWYEDRGPVKLVILVGIAVFMSAVSLILLTVFYSNIRSNLLLVTGVTIVLGFTIIKGIGYKDAERLYGVMVGPFRSADYIEFSGIVIAMIAALRRRESA